MAHSPEAVPLLDGAGVISDDGVLPLNRDADAKAFIDAAGNGRIWPREPLVRTVY
jgi:hypothetical protein